VSHNDSQSRRRFLFQATAGASAAAAAGKPPNILYIHSHDSGRYLQPYGHPTPSPNLQKLASEGVLFRNAFSAAPTCSPSRAALLTGECPHQNGMLGLAHRGFALNDYRKHILYTLRDAGYVSILGGLQHIADKPEKIGYDEILRHGSNHAADVTPGVVAFLNRRPSKPFFLDVGFQETHREFPKPTTDDDPRYTQPPAPVPDTPATRYDMASFHACARNMDRGVGQVLDALERNGLAGNTIVISTTDHGIAFPRMKCNLLDTGWGVSMIVRGPGVFTGGKVCDAMISHIDIYPTLCDLLGLKRPARLTGQSFLPVLRDEAKEINEEIFAEVTYHAAYEPKRAVRTHRYKYIRRFGDFLRPVLPNCDDSPSKDVWLEYGWGRQTLPREDLYDLVFDPSEHRNLAADPDSRKVLEEMRGRLDAWMKRTNDPLLNGPVPLPPGARVNPQDGVSPKDPPGTRI
jgi:N-sulfoglucosamine sulfohydrolase